VRASRASAAVAIIAGLLFSALPTSALASSSTDWAELQQKIRDTRAKVKAAQRKERGILAQLAASDARRLRLERNLTRLTNELAGATGRLDVLEAALAQAQGELDLKNQDLEEAVGLLRDQTSLLGSRTARSYMNGPSSFAAVVLNAADFQSFITADRYVQSVLDADVATLDGIRGLKTQIESDRATISRRKAMLQQQADVVQQQRDRIATIRTQQATARAAVLREIDYRKQLLSKVRTEKEAYLKALQSYLRESASIAALLRAAQRGQRVIAGAGKGYLRWPISGTISSPYGWRIHPIYHYRSFHTGIDIAAPSGRTVHAARAGEILYVGYRGAYGLIVLIDHGSAVATMYAHLSKVYVRPGQYVRTGSSIAAEGCTGWCTGPHLHFEVRVDGSPQNPKNWL
jgi:murein DD-endopeptidase MepM/ murein hydrolase activator NlpD